MKSRLITIMLVIFLVMPYFPSLNNSASGKKPTLIANCTNLSTTTTPFLGTPVNLTFTCGSSPAFRAQQTTVSSPSYSLPTGYNALYIQGSVIAKLTSGVSLTLSQGNYVYLAQYDGFTANALPSFTITWNSG